MKESLVCITHAEQSIRSIFAGQKILILTNIKDQGIVQCADITPIGRCQSKAAVKVLIFGQNEHAKE